MKNVLTRLRRVALVGLSDRELLEILVTHRDDAAFEVLLCRHGPMVFAVCRRVLGNVHDAEDAFQATFLVLVRKASSVHRREALGSWLYGVAYRTARKLRALTARRQSKEQQTAVQPWCLERRVALDLDDELSGLPEKYRVPVVLCELEGRSRKEVARQLQIAEGTLSSRLATARKTLAKQLRRHGWSFPDTTTCMLPVSLLTATTRAAGLLLSGQDQMGIISEQVLNLAEGVIKAMLVNKIKAVTFALVALGALGVGTTLSVYRGALVVSAQAQEPSSVSAAQLQQATADLQEAQAQLGLAQAHAAMAQAEVARREAVYQEALKRTQRGFDPKDLQAATASLLGRFRYRVPFEIGKAESQQGGRVEILEVWGTRPLIEIGGQYIVRGRYAIPSHERGKLYLWETATDNWKGEGVTSDLQYCDASPGHGDFTLLHTMAGPGYFHVVLTGSEKGQDVTFADVYFGTGDTVLRGNERRGK